MNAIELARLSGFDNVIWMKQLSPSWENEMTRKLARLFAGSYISGVIGRI